MICTCWRSEPRTGPDRYNEIAVPGIAGPRGRSRSTLSMTRTQSFRIVPRVVSHIGRAKMTTLPAGSIHVHARERPRWRRAALALAVLLLALAGDHMTPTRAGIRLD